jgi:aminoglycoside N3'-acetyltransferase
VSRFLESTLNSSEKSTGLAELLQDGRRGPIVCHVDLFGAAPQVNAGYKRDDILRAHVQNIERCADGRPVWIPTFNYDFPKSQLFDARTSPSQVGIFTEYFRKNIAQWRVPIPMFSFAGIGDRPSMNVVGQIDAFGGNSVFSQIVQRDSTIVFYGAEVISATILHHAESLTSGPVYRYKKSFPGKVVTLDGQEAEVTLMSHVRPLNKILSYDAAKMTQDLKAAGLLVQLPISQGKICAVGAKELVEYWKQRILEDSFYLLDEASRQWIELEYARLGRRFVISDFEDHR